ncbi:hypothetical protein AHAS_Ahas02G0245400 [Arachis hypogaea]
MTVIQPAIKLVVRRCSKEHDMVDEAYINLTLARVMVLEFVMDLIGIHSIFDTFVFGLTISKEGNFEERENFDNVYNGF